MKTTSWLLSRVESLSADDRDDAMELVDCAAETLDAERGDSGGPLSGMVEAIAIVVDILIPGRTVGAAMGAPAIGEAIESHDRPLARALLRRVLALVHARRAARRAQDREESRRGAQPSARPIVATRSRMAALHEAIRPRPMEAVAPQADEVSMAVLVEEVADASGPVSS